MSYLYASDSSIVTVDTIDEKAINYFNKLLDRFIKKKRKSVTSSTYTHNGYQTANIVNHISDYYKQSLLKQYFNSYELLHVHMIHYYTGGSQKVHHHQDHDKFSFILYLNDADGDTVFYFDKEVSVSPERGKIVYFSGNLLHEGKESFQEKRVLVGGLR